MTDKGKLLEEWHGSPRRLMIRTKHMAPPRHLAAKRAAYERLVTGGLWRQCIRLAAAVAVGFVVLGWLLMR